MNRFLAACRGAPVDRTPIWIMRQAGRYMPEYRALRERYGILEIIKTPELAVEVTMQPMRAFALDAAIIFADILPLLEGLGLELEFVKGRGPVIHNPVRSAEDVDALRRPPVEEALGFTLRAVELARSELSSERALVGFSGAPFTLACYAIEGGSARHFATAKRFMYAEPDAWHRLLELLSEQVGRYLAAQAAAGADAVQLFDSWAGLLSPADYRTFVLPHSRRALELAGTAVPRIHFGTGTAGFLEDFAAAGGEVVGVDWRMELGAARRRLGPDVPLQGNLDPTALLAPWDVLREQADAVLAEMVGQRGHIFNLGHGVLPPTPPDNVARLADYVHAVTARRPETDAS